MAAFVERAVMMVVDQASGPVKKINRELNALFATASKLRSMKLNIDVKSPNTKKASADLKRLLADVNKVKNAKADVNVRVGNLGAVERRVQALQNRLNNLNGRVNVNGGGGNGRGGRGGNGLSLGGSIGGGFGIIGGFNAVTTAALLASRALTAMAAAASDRDRTNLLLNTAASPKQKAILNQLVTPASGARTNLMSQDDRMRLAQSLLGDVGGNEEQRATRSAGLTSYLEKNVLPRVYAQQPGATAEEALKGLRALVQGMNLASAEIMDERGNLTKRGADIIQAEQLAMAADPSLTPEFMRTTFANLKTSAFSLSPEGLAAVLVNAGARGQRAGNEAFRAQQSMLGMVDNKVLNNSLVDQGLLLGAKRNKKGNVIAGTGTAVDQDTLMTDPQTWFRKHVGEPMEDALSKVTPNIPITQAERVAYLNQKFPGANASAKQGIADAVLGDAQMQNSIAQAKLVLDNTNAASAVQKSVNANLEALKNTAKDNAAKSTEPFLEPTATVLDSINGWMRQRGEENKSLVDQIKGGPLGIFNMVGRLIDSYNADKKPITDLKLGKPVLAGFGGAETAKATSDIAVIKEGKKQLVTTFTDLMDRSKQFDTQHGIDRSLFPSRSYAVDVGVTSMSDSMAKLNEAEQKRQAVITSAAQAVTAATKVEEDRATRARVDRTGKSTRDEKANFKAAGLTMKGQTERSGGAENVRLIQLRIGAMADGVFGPRTWARYQAAVQDNLTKNAPAIARRDQLEGRKDKDLSMVKALTPGESAAAQIEQAFSTGGTSAGSSVETGITSGGNSAAEAMRSAIAGAGSAAGDSIAGAMRAAAANVTINVRQPTPGASVGPSHPGKD